MVVKCEFNRSIFSLEKCGETSCGGCQFGSGETEAEPETEDDEEDDEED